MKIAWLGNAYFCSTLQGQGCDIAHLPFDLRHPFTWNSVPDLCNGQAPDAVVVTDTSTPPMVLGVESFPCLTVFYAVDTHIHSWFPYYAQAFDACLVSLKNALPDFVSATLTANHVHWFPPYIMDERVPKVIPREKPLEVVFHGTVNRAIKPERAAFLDALREYARKNTTKKPRRAFRLCGTS